MLTMIAMNVSGAKSNVAEDLRVRAVRVARFPACIQLIARQSKRPSSKMHGECSLQNLNSRAFEISRLLFFL
jgi:hypothetical protein